MKGFPKTCKHTWWDKPHNCDNQEHVNAVNFLSCVCNACVGEMAWTGLTIALLLVPQCLDAKCQTERNQEAVSTEDHRGHTLWPERGSGIKTGGNENDIERERCRVVSFGVSSRWLQAAASPAGPLSRPFSPLPSNLPPSPQKSTTLKHSE